MFGSYRFFLALLVAVEHMRLVTEFHLGVLAVTGFYILAGYVMNYSFSRNFSLDIRKVPHFYLDRFLRIYPIYVFVCLAVLLFFLISQPSALILKPFNYFVNFTLIPLNYFMFLGDPNYFLLNPNGIPVPPAPSLALEVQFYLVIPFILFYRWLRNGLLVLSFFIFCLALFSKINIYYFGYMLLPGMLSVFLIGTLLYNVLHGIDLRFCKTALGLMLGILGSMSMFFFLTRFELYNREILIGIFSSVGAITVLSKVKAQSKLDTFLGNLSYPIFLSHWFSIWIFDLLLNKFPFTMGLKMRATLQVFLTIVLSSGIYYLVDANVQRWRKKIQKSPAFSPARQESVSSPILVAERK